MNNNNQNIDKAKEWFLKAAREGSYEALYKLGQMIGPKGQYIQDYVRIAIIHYEIEKLVIPNSVNFIDSSAFAGCKNLQSVIIPNSVTFIGSCAFADCISLQSVIIPDSVTDIWDGAFDGCRSLQNIVIPANVTNIGTGALANCDSLRKITMPNGLKNFPIVCLTKYDNDDKPYKGTVEYY